MPLALPDYLRRQDFNDCPPGHRFGLYFDGWTDSFGMPGNGKTGAFKAVADSLPKHSRDALEALRLRQQAAAEKLGADVLIHPARLTAPLATGLGNEHPLENGFTFLNPHGLPYLPGSGAKGAIRRAAEELASGEWGDPQGWSQPAIDALFGPGEDRLDQGADFRCGALAFWDVFFVPPKNRGALAVEIMTPHHAGYLQGSGSPHANEPPNPIPFLAIPAGAECRFAIQCNPALIEDAALSANWTALLAAALEHAGEWLGFGAKSAVGYGRLAPDRKALAAQEAAARKRGEEALEKAREEAERARLATLPAWEQTVASVLAAKPKDVKDYDALLKALEANRWPDAEERTRVAARVAQLLKEHGQWRERSEKKNPAKDEPYQRTLRLKKFL